MLSTIEKKFILGSVGVLGILILIGFTSFWSLQRLVTQSKEVGRIRTSVEELSETISHMKDAETGVRGFLLTANPQFLEPYHLAQKLVVQHMKTLESQLFSKTNRQVHLPRLQTLILQKLTYSQNIIAYRYDHPVGNLTDNISLAEGKKLMDHIRGQISLMQEEEKKVLFESEQEQARTVSYTQAIIIISSGIAICIVFLVLFLLRKDILKRTQAEKKLSESERMLKEAQQIARLGHWEYNVATQQLMISDALYPILGIPQNDPGFRTVEHVYRLLSPDQAQHLKQKLEQCIETASSYQTEYDIIVNGRKKCIFNLVYPQVNAEGKVIRVNGTSQDITERKRTEEALRKSEARFSSIFSLIPLPCAITRFSDGKILEANKKALEAFGFSQEETRDATTLQLNLYPNPAMRNELLEQLRQKKVIQFENSFRNKHGKIWNAITSMEEIELDGEKCILTIIQDITDRKQNEEAIKAYSEQMEQINASKDKFFSIIAHDLMSPVNGVIGAANLLTNQISGLNPKEISQFSQAILISANNLKRFLSNLLEWAQTQSGQMVFKPNHINLRALVLDVAGLLKDPAQSKSIRMTIRIPDYHEVEADVNMIHSVLRNLLSNAIKFSRLGGEIDITSEMLADRIRVDITDSGVGMSKTVQEQLFRIDSKHTTLGTAGEKGTGLGLLLCKEFVEKHRGEIWVESEEGKGTTFSFTLPSQPLMVAQSAR